MIAAQNKQNVAIIGSRSFKDREYITQTLDWVWVVWGDFHVVSGGAPGADTLGEEWAKSKGDDPTIFPAKWDDISAPGALIGHRSDGTPYNKLAGHWRNRQIIEAADVVIAFWDGKSTGTADSILWARKKGIDVWVFWPGKDVLHIVTEKGDF